jgi:3-isopropylmalate/(R)-2-methylmalate dehydratase large subunit
MPTLAQKIIARAAGRTQVAVGEIVTCKVDLAMSHDSSGPRRVAPMLESLGARIRNPDKYVIVTDHYVPARDPESQQILRFTRDWVQSTGIRNFHDEQGICHVVLPEQGHIRPGMRRRRQPLQHGRRVRRLHVRHRRNRNVGRTGDR